MHIVETIKAMQDLAGSVRKDGRRIALVPTMGYLHEGHLSLIRLARARADFVVVSLFVNPAQFGPSEDFDRYPRDFARDEHLCRAENVDALFCPSADEMYAPVHSVYVDEVAVSRTYEGESRPGHFRGVLTVVAKLFLATLPDIAVFGRKDAQQLFLVHKMTRELNFPIELVAGPTVREPDGLAMSSRNAYLTEPLRAQATCLHRALQRAVELHRAGERNAYVLRKAMMDIVQAEPDAEMDYIEIVDADTFAPVTAVSGSSRALMAVRFGKTRLIDNMDL